MPDDVNDNPVEPYGIDPPPTTPTAPPPPPVQPVFDLATEDVPCRNCGFNLRGLSPEGKCPECGADVFRSIQEDKLIYCGGAYLRLLYRGLVCILIAALTNAVIGLIGIITVPLVIFSALNGGSTLQWLTTNQPVINVLGQTFSLPVSMLMLYGWWLFSSPDPGQRAEDTGQKPRRVVRIATIIMACATALAAVCYSAALVIPWMEHVATGVGLLGAVAGIVQFFASMFYLRWMAPRIPSPAIEKRSQLYMWLLPVIYIVGICVLGLGPIVAAIMYFLLLNEVRVILKSIIERQAPSVDPNTHMDAVVEP